MIKDYTQNIIEFSAIEKQQIYYMRPKINNLQKISALDIDGLFEVLIH